MNIKTNSYKSTYVNVTLYKTAEIHINAYNSIRLPAPHWLPIGLHRHSLGLGPRAWAQGPVLFFA